MQGLGRGLSININSPSKNDSFISADLIKLLIREGSTPLSVTKDAVCQWEGLSGRFLLQFRTFGRTEPRQPRMSKGTGLTSHSYTHTDTHTHTHTHTHTLPQRRWKPWSPPPSWEASNVFLIEIEASRNREIYLQKLYSFWSTNRTWQFWNACVCMENGCQGKSDRPGFDLPGGRTREAGSRLLLPCLSRGTGCPMGPADATTFSWEYL